MRKESSLARIAVCSNSVSRQQLTINKRCISCSCTVRCSTKQVQSELGDAELRCQQRSTEMEEVATHMLACQEKQRSFESNVTELKHALEKEEVHHAALTV